MFLEAGVLHQEGLEQVVSSNLLVGRFYVSETSEKDRHGALPFQNAKQLWLSPRVNHLRTQGASEALLEGATRAGE